jgi:xanthine dehydrogenase accessory factor
MDTYALQRLAELPDDAAAKLAVVVAVEGSAYRGPGAMRVWTPGEPAAGVVSGGCLEADLDERPLPPDGRGVLLRYDLRGGPEDLWGLAAGCNGLVEIWLQAVPAGRPSPYRSAARWLAAGVAATVTTVLETGEQWAEAADGRTEGRPRPLAPGERVFVDRRVPAPVLVVYGRGPDAAPVADLARRVGFRVRQLGRGDDLEALCAAEPPAAAVVMSHHFPGDREALEILLRHRPQYLGVLGPRERTRRLLPEPWPPCVYAPVGLDIGAEDAEEIAVAVIAQALAVLRGASGGHLRDRPGPIHPRRGAGGRP